MGGVEVDNNLEVDGIKNCYCAGEASNAKVHGANRLGGNSLLEIVAFGRVAGESAANRAKGVIFKEPDDIFIKEATKAIEYLLAKDGKSFYSARKELGDIFFEDVGIIREQKGLNRALERVKTMQLEFADMGIKDRSKVANSELVEFLEFANMLTLAPVVISMALARQESRGAHIRADFPNSDNNFLKSFIFRLRGVNEDNNQ
jgi:succinate dehydrogenase / fumarate reductase flavoprotein subunit